MQNRRQTFLHSFDAVKHEKIRPKSLCAHSLFTSRANSPNKEHYQRPRLIIITTSDLVFRQIELVSLSASLRGVTAAAAEAKKGLQRICGVWIAPRELVGLTDEVRRTYLVGDEDPD
jgi:hypothetical protein